MHFIYFIMLFFVRNPEGQAKDFSTLKYTWVAVLVIHAFIFVPSFFYGTNDFVQKCRKQKLRVTANDSLIFKVFEYGTSLAYTVTIVFLQTHYVVRFKYEEYYKKDVGKNQTFILTEKYTKESLFAKIEEEEGLLVRWFFIEIITYYSIVISSIVMIILQFFLKKSRFVGYF